jgi:hypothetical protein
MEEQKRESFSLLNNSAMPQNGFNRNSALGGNKQAAAKKLVIKNLKITPQLPADFQVTLFRQCCGSQKYLPVGSFWDPHGIRI